MAKIEIRPSHRMDCIKEYYFSKKNREIAELRKQGRDIISLGIGSPDMPPHQRVIDRLASEAQRDDVHAYQPYNGSELLREAYAAWYEKWYNVKLNPKTEVLPLLGSKEGIMHICMAFLDAGDKVLVPNPGYPTYRAAVTLAGGDVVEYHLNESTDFYPDFEAIEKEDLSRVKLMFVNYPNMPTGTLPTVELFEKLVAFAQKHNILLVHDNPYSFVRNNLQLSLLSIPGAWDVAIEMNSTSKGHSMAGWRVGVVVGRSEWIADILRFKSNMDSGMFFPVQAAAAEALALDNEWFDELNTTYYAREAAGYALLDALGCEYRKNQAGLFVWAKIPASFEGDCFAFSDKVLDECDVFVTPGGIFGSEGEHYIRISLCMPKERLAEAAERVKSRFTK
ncbi:MAG: aminotransferase class I/II-fold pyridoxal phosphate-dependent enzyme [Alistipes sp.]|nr:aminotransferase class I/II-fold pyridoxal phosphate-dependent enzyme [Alistipes sp.]